MTEATCPTCGGKCNKITVPDGGHTHSRYMPLQPDLTKLRELDRKYGHIVAVCQLSQKGWDLMRQAVKELLEDKP